MSTTNNNAPFAPGQKVVAVADSKFGYFKKDEPCKIASDIKCSSCGHQWVSVGKSAKTQLGKCICGTHLIATDDLMYHDHRFFAPINPSYSDATQSILEQFRKDEAVKDKCDSPVKEIINQ